MTRNIHSATLNDHASLKAFLQEISIEAKKVNLYNWTQCERNPEELGTQ